MTGPIPSDWTPRLYRIALFGVVCLVLTAPVTGTAAALFGDHQASTTQTTDISTAGAKYEVTSMTVPDTAMAGDPVTVEATIKNNGTASGAQNVEIRVNGTTRKTVDSVRLFPGKSETISTTLSLTGGDHRITVATADDSRTQTVDVEAIDGTYFSVRDFQGPPNVIQNRTATVNATISNAGSENGTQTVAYRIDTDGDGSLEASETFANRTVRLTSGNSIPVEFDPVVDAPAGTFTHGIVTANESDTATLVVEDADGIPTADAGEDRTVTNGTRVVLNGTNSTDANDDSLNYTWTQVAGDFVTLFDSDTATPEFTAPDPRKPTTLVFRLTVSDGEYSDTDVVNVTVTPTDAPPVASAGKDRTVDEATRVEVNASKSYDPDGGSISYFWEQISGPEVTFSNANVVAPTIRTPEVDEETDITLRVTVTDDEGDFERDQVTLTVGQFNDPPVADAGENRTVDEGATVTLDATGSTDRNGDSLSYSWTQVGGPDVSLTSATTAMPEFTAPDVSSERTLTFEVLVNDGNFHSDTDRVRITVAPSNDPPTADAGTDRTVDSGTEVALDGTGSSDPDGDSLSYSWTQTGGPDVALRDADTAGPSFTAPTVTTTTELTFELTVSDGNGNEDTDTVSVAVDPSVPKSDQISRSLDDSNAVPGGEVRVTLTAEFETGHDRVSILDGYEGPIADGSISAVRINGSDGTDSVSLRRIDNESMTVALEDVGAGSTVEIVYVADVADDADVGDVLRFEGSPGRPDVSAGDFAADFGTNETTVAEESEPDPVGVTASRQVARPQVGPGETVNVTLETTVDASVDRLAIRDEFEGAVSSATTTAILVNGSSVEMDAESVIRAEADADDLNVTLAGVGADATVTVEYAVTVSSSAENGDSVRYTGLTGQPDVLAGDAGANFGTNETTVSADSPGVARELERVEVSPGGTLTVTITAEFDRSHDGVAIVDGYTGPIAGASIESITENGSSKSARFTNTNENGLTVALEDVSAGSVVEVTYELDVEDDATLGSTVSFVGNDDGPDVNAGDRARNFGPDSATLVEAAGPVARADANGDGKIDDDELRAAIVDWSSDVYDDDEIRKIIVAWSSS